MFGPPPGEVDQVSFPVDVGQATHLGLTAQRNILQVASNKSLDFHQVEVPRILVWGRHVDPCGLDIYSRN